MIINDFSNRRTIIQKTLNWCLAFALLFGLAVIAAGCDQSRKKGGEKKAEKSQTELRRIISSSIKAMEKVRSFKCREVEVEMVGDDTTTTTRYLEWIKPGRLYEKDSTGREYYLVEKIVYAREATNAPWQKMTIPEGEEEQYQMEEKLPAMPQKVIEDLCKSQNLTDLGEEKIKGQKCWVINFLFKPSSPHSRLRSAETVWISQSTFLVLKFERSWEKSVFHRGNYVATYSDYNRSFEIALPEELDIEE